MLYEDVNSAGGRNFASISDGTDNHYQITRGDGGASTEQHRWPGILEESKKFFIYQYPGKMPIPDDVGKERMGMRKIGRPVSNTSANMFGF